MIINFYGWDWPSFSNLIRKYKTIPPLISIFHLQIHPDRIYENILFLASHSCANIYSPPTQCYSVLCQPIVTNINRSDLLPIGLAQPFTPTLWDSIFGWIKHKLPIYNSFRWFHWVWLSHLHPWSPIWLFAKLWWSYTNARYLNLASVLLQFL